MDGRIGWVGIGLAALAAATPSPSPNPSPSPTPSFASAGVALSVSSGEVGTYTTISGQGFPPNESYALYFDNPNPYVATPPRLNGGPQTDDHGTFRFVVLIPDLAYGPHQLCADTGFPGSTEPYSIRACASFAVEAAVTLDKTSGPPGTLLTITGTGFPPGYAAIYIEGNGPNGPFFGTPGPPISGNGSFGETIYWPTISFGYIRDPTAPGLHKICGDTDARYTNEPGPDVKACADFLVSSLSPTLTLDPTSGPSGTQLTIRGSGFAPRASYAVTVDGKALLCSTNPAEYSTDADGGFTAHFTVEAQMHIQPCPSVAPVPMTVGRHHVCGQTGTIAACADFTVLAPPQPAGAVLVPASMRMPVAIGALVLLILLAIVSVLGLRRSKQRRG